MYKLARVHMLKGIFISRGTCACVSQELPVGLCQGTAAMCELACSVSAQIKETTWDKLKGDLQKYGESKWDWTGRTAEGRVVGSWEGRLHR